MGRTRRAPECRNTRERSGSRDRVLPEVPIRQWTRSLLEGRVAKGVTNLFQ